MSQGIDVEHWKVYTSLFGGGGPMGQTNLGTVDDGGTVIDSPSYSLAQIINTYQTIGEYNSVTFQAQWRGRQLEGDVVARRTAETLYALKLQEENWLINVGANLWAPPAPPLLSTSPTGGAIAANTNWIQVTAVNANGQTLASKVASIVTTGATSTITVNIFGVPNAVTYNIYAGTGATQPAASAMWLQSATGSAGTDPMNLYVTVTLTAALATSGTALSSVASNTAITRKGVAGNALTFDGALALLLNNQFTPGSTPSIGENGESTVVLQPAAASGLLALTDPQRLFQQMYRYARARPSHLFCSPQEMVTLGNLYGANANARIVVDGSSAQQVGHIVAGTRVTEILNQATGDTVQVEVLPYLPQGTMVAASFALPYTIPNMGIDSQNPFRIQANMDYYMVTYPPAQGQPTKYAFGCFVDETLINQFLGGWSAITGIVAAN